MFFCLHNGLNYVVVKIIFIKDSLKYDIFSDGKVMRIKTNYNVYELKIYVFISL